MSTQSDSYDFGGANARVDAATAELVERGLAFQKSLGKTVASAYFKEQRVPDAVSRRILAPTQPRRAPPAGARRD